MISDELTLFFESRPLDGNADIPMYNELQNRILDFIRTHSDTKEFPSEREFAALLKINRRTLHKAIEPLIADGTLIRTRKKTLINRTKETNLKTGASGIQSKQTDKMKQQLRFLVQMTSPDELSFWKMVVKKFEELFPTIQLHIETPVGADPKSEYIARLESGMFDLTELPTYINWKDAFTNHLLPVKESYLKLFDTDDFLSGKWTSSVPELRQFAIPWSLSFQIMEWDTDPAKLQDLGRDIVAKEAESKWGSGFFNQLSLDMRAMFPDEKGFPSANLRYMKRWYEFYYQRIVNLQQPVEEIEKVNFQQPVEDLKMPEFAGKLNFYVTAADKLLRAKDDNPSVGLLICKTAKKTIVEWSLQDIQKPLGVASYQLQEVVERTIAELENLKKDDVEEI